MLVSAISSVQSLSHVWPFATPWTTAHQASLSITNSPSLLKLMSIELVILSNYLILCWHLLRLLSIFPSTRVFSNESVLCIRRPEYWSFSFSTVLAMNIQDWFPLGLTGLISLLSKGLSRVFSNSFSHRANVYLHEEFMGERNHVNVRYVGSSSAKALTYIHTEQLTQERNPINAMRVAKNSISALSFVYTEEHTLQRNPTNVMNTGSVSVKRLTYIHTKEILVCNKHGKAFCHPFLHLWSTKANHTGAKLGILWLKLCLR